MAADDDPTKPTIQPNESEELPPSVDFLSPDFDPLEALQTEGLQPPNPRVRALDNLNRCRHLLPEVIPESVVNISPKTRSAESIEAQERAKARTFLLLEKKAEDARQKKIFDILAEKAKGPLKFLSVCRQERGRVQVWTRHTHGVRGSMIGFLHAFDHHMNMILQDVEEVYTVRRHVPRLVNKRVRRSKTLKDDSNNECSSAFGSSDLSIVKVEAVEKLSEVVDDSDKKNASTVFKSSDLSKVHAQDVDKSSAEIDDISEGLKELRLFPKLEHRCRHVGQVFLRGDSVVMVRRVQ